MFTCSSCGYEANPDSAPACSLCGTKKPGAGGSAVRTAPKPATVSDNDELASAAAAVAESADSAPPPAKAAAKPASKGAPRGSTAGPTQSRDGVLRSRQEPAEIANASTALGAFVGSLLGYIFAWHQAGHAPADFMSVVLILVLAVVFGLVGRFVLTSMLDTQLSFSGREVFAGPVAGIVGLGFLVLTVFGFWQGGRVASVTPEEAPSAAVVGTDGRVLAEHLALLTPWNVKIKTDKHITFSSGKDEVRIPLAKLSPEDVSAIQKALGPTWAPRLEMLAADEPFTTAARLPEEFSLDTFFDRAREAYGVNKDTTTKAPVGKMNLTRRRSNGTDEALSIPERVAVAGDLANALPKGAKLWIAVALGLPTHQGAPVEHEQFVSETLDKYGPTN